MAGFPALEPAFTMLVEIDAPHVVGSASRGASLQVVPMTGGSIKSEGSFSPALDAEFVGVGNDYIHADPDGGHLRLNAHGVVKTKDSEPALIYVNYTGVVKFGDHERAVLSGAAEDLSTPFGNSFVHITFETGDARYKELENKVYVGQGRFNAVKGKPIVVEYRVGKVIHT
ncbi:hypothetical protein P175DRAFT_0529703 [Aspergillus ochraceoroseus IBT 24754]|uniref:Uncharacterized protein n=3 Tax=Aspergillus subgen. Nidulantes TaxID=2720870 RepID=A0A0F8WW35_9EURO|nr:uncharacterized protein P175DRAFT_0529703 [Aspergillus ochraceoroseus IBT 24754]KKK15557.1 hypothetical protein ARAM_005312 [Aspergillus rambellii]KKK16664.1 hypothetical protein AOCH_007022 [Aspergillus ochraceoroseus]PTU22631.1 hypothetical protein P175DRAFT_0529703 [Aspergillus ochraceoroseus IBT 24754]